MMDIAKVSVPPKRKGGRTSRWAMKKNKQKPTDNLKPKESVNLQNKRVPQLPPIPSLEIQSLSTAIEDFMDLEPDPEYMDLSEQIKCQETEGIDKLDLDTILLAGCGGERERGQLQLQFQDEATTDKDCMWCPNYSKNATEIQGPCEEGNSDIEVGGVTGVLCSKDVLDTCFLDVACGDLTFEERECNKDDHKLVGVADPSESEVWCIDKIAATSEDQIEIAANLSSNNGERHSIGSDFDDIWDWESVVLLNNDQVCDNSWDAKDNLLAWLWEDDDLESVSQESGEIDQEKQNAMVAWFLS